VTPLGARILLYTAVAGWGVTFVANHELLKTLDPLQIVVLRFVGVAAAFATFFLLVPSRRPRLGRRDWRWLIFGGFLAVPAAQLFAVAGQQFLPPAMTGLVVTSAPAFAAVLAYRFLGERLSVRQVVGIAFALVGVTVVILYATGTGTDLVVANPLGAALVVLSQVAWASYTVLGRSFAVRYDPFTMVATVFLVGSAMLVPFLPHALSGVSQISVAQWWWLVHLIIGGTLIPHVVWFVALRHLTATDTAVSMYLVPVYATTFSVLILSEDLTTVGILGGLAILVGVGLSQSRRRRVPVEEDLMAIEPGV
jgi:drug/metabolite transporter (DMT)-like permease